MDVSQKKLMILGAGRYQVPLIKGAIELGIETHVCSILGDYPGMGLSEHFHEVDIANAQEVLKLAQQIQPDGILTTATDVCLESIGLVVETMNLPGSGIKASSSCLNKLLMKQNLVAAKVPTADYQVIEDVESALDFFNNSSSACVIKPSDSSGSRGVSKIVDSSDIETAYNSAKEFSKSGVVLIEEWLDGEEFGAQAVVKNGQCELLVIHSDVTTAPPRRIPVGHGCPHPNETNLQAMVQDMVNDAIKAIGINNTVSNIDFILTENGPKIIELTCRMGGTRLPEVCGTYWGIDFYVLAIQLALGNKIQIPATPQGKPNAAHNLILEREGKIIRMESVKPRFVQETWFGVGDRVPLNVAKLAEFGYIQLIQDEASSILPDLIYEVNRVAGSVVLEEDQR